MIKTCVKLPMFALLLSTALFAIQINAYEKGDFIVRTGVAMVDSREDSRKVFANGGVITGSSVSLDNDIQLGLTATYMITNNIGIEVLAATPFTTTVSGSGVLAGVGTIAEAKYLPPTVSAQYFFDTQTIATPYVGVGINYTMMLETTATTNGSAALGGGGSLGVEVDDSFGLALQAGVDVALTEHLIFNAAVWYIDIETEITLSDKVTPIMYKVDVDIDPWVYMIGLGYKF